MRIWHKYHNYKIRKNNDGTKSWLIIVDGVEVEVSKEIYLAYAQGARKMKYMELNLKRDRVLQDENGRVVTDSKGQPVTLPEREVSLDRLIDYDWDFPVDTAEPEEMLLQMTEPDELHRCLDGLYDDDRALIQALFFERNTEREYAETLGLSKTALHARKVKTLEKLKKQLEQ